MDLTEALWYLMDGVERRGPYSAQQILRAWQRGKLTGWDWCWREGMEQCQRLAEIEPFATYQRQLGVLDPALIRFHCVCGNLVVMSKRFAGKAVRCQKCQRVLQVPLASETESFLNEEAPRGQA